VGKITQNTYQCNIFNIDGFHSYMEMVLSSLFDNSFATAERTIVATNSALEYRYTRGMQGSRFTVTVLSPSKMDEVFVVKYGSKPFPISGVLKRMGGSDRLLDFSQL
jgi:hypothetical protein